MALFVHHAVSPQTQAWLSQIGGPFNHGSEVRLYHHALPCDKDSAFFVLAGRNAFFQQGAAAQNKRF
jgi:hypothetical protein